MSSSSQKITGYFKTQRNPHHHQGGGGNSTKRKKVSGGSSSGDEVIQPLTKSAKLEEREIPSTPVNNNGRSSPSCSSPVKFLQKGMLSPAKKKKKGEEDNNGQPRPSTPLTATQVKSLLKKSGKLEDLKKALGALQKHQQKKKKEEVPPPAPPTVKSPMKEVRKEEFYSPQKVRRNFADDDVFTSPVKLSDIKSSPEKVPAYKRFRHLVDPTPSVSSPCSTPVSKISRKVSASSGNEEISLPLPHHHSTLLSLFSATETVLKLSLNTNKDPTCSFGLVGMEFSKLKKSVQQLVRTVNFKESHVGQFLSVMSGCYEVEREQESNELRIRFPRGEGKNKIKNDLPLDGRKKEFKEKLVQICIKEHEAFLALKLEIPIPPNTKITRFHPSFDVESMIPQVSCTEIPPLFTKTPATAKELLLKAQSLVQNNARVRAALMKQANKKNENTPAPSLSSAVTSTSKATSVSTTRKELKGISASLLAKIRAREAAKTLQTLTLPPDEIRKETLLKSLPKYVKTIRSIFVSEKKPSLPMDEVVDKLGFALYDNRTQGDMVRDTVRLLNEKFPHFCKILKLDGGEEWIKLDLKIDVNALTLL